MSEAVKYTPGPRFPYGRYIGTKNHMSAVGECRDVNGNWSDDAKSSANARLIAAAPELLAVVKEYVTEEWSHMDDEELARELSLGNEMVRNHIAARAAIAKAEGRS